MALLEELRSTLIGGGALPELTRKEIARALACADASELVIAKARLLGFCDDYPEVPAVFLSLDELRSRRAHDEAASELRKKARRT
jgi:hypothetical protein